MFRYQQLEVQQYRSGDHQDEDARANRISRRDSSIRDLLAVLARNLTSLGPFVDDAGSPPANPGS